MKTTIHKAESRGQADHGWLNSNHSFSFASYYNPERMGFGLLRVINDDVVAPGAGFSTHPHQNMEIVSIPLSGALRHKDSEGNQTVIQHGEVQLMSAGTGVYHSEYNDSHQEDVNFLQIWVHPEKIGIAPRYDQLKFSEAERKNQFQTVVSPMDKDGGGVKINQQAWFSLADLDEGSNVNYQIQKSGNGAYLLVLEGAIKVGENTLGTKDAIALEDATEVTVQAQSHARVLLIEVPMN